MSDWSRPLAGNIAIVQCVCPKRHCILALAADLRTVRPIRAIKILQNSVRTMVASGMMNPHCGLCNASISEWGYEVGGTRFETLQEAEPVLRAAEEAQLRSAAYLKNFSNN